MKEILKSDWNYILYEDNGRYILSVTCGRSAVYQKEIYLNNGEIKLFREQGECYIGQLADNVRNSPE